MLLLAHLKAIGARWEAHNLTEGTFKNLVAITTINSIAVIPTITLNGLVIIAVATRHRLRSKSNMLLAFLAVTGLLLGLLSQPLRIALELKRIFNVGPFCTVVEKGSILISIALSPATVGHLILISIDRYIAIKKTSEVSAHCHQKARDKLCGFGVGCYIVCDNSRNRLGFNTKWIFFLLCLRDCVLHDIRNYRTRLYLCNCVRICLYFLRNKASKTSSNRAIIIWRSPKNQKRQKTCKYSWIYCLCLSLNLSSRNGGPGNNHFRKRDSSTC